jgi:predicted DNA-binding protein
MQGGLKMSMKKNLTVRLDDKTRESLELIADREMRPLANQINFFIREGIERYVSQNGLVLLENDEDQSLSLVHCH